MLKKYLITKYTDGGFPDRNAGPRGEFEEYGRDEAHAIERAQARFSGATYHYVIVGEIKQ